MATVVVEIPAGLVAGDEMLVQAGEQEFIVVLPAGVVAGELLEVTLPAPAPAPSEDEDTGDARCGESDPRNGGEDIVPTYGGDMVDDGCIAAYSRRSSNER